MTDDSESMSAMPEEFTEALEDFQGAALTVRFDDGALEMEMAGDSALTEKSLPTTDKGDDVLATLPEDTAAAIGVGLPEGWFSTMLDQIEHLHRRRDDRRRHASPRPRPRPGSSCPTTSRRCSASRPRSRSAPTSTPRRWSNSSSPRGCRSASRSRVTRRRSRRFSRRSAPRSGRRRATLLISESDGDKIAIGLDQDYVSELLEDGDLGDSEVFQNVVREADDASSILFVNFDARSDGWLAKVAGDDKEAATTSSPWRASA